MTDDVTEEQLKEALGDLHPDQLETTRADLLSWLDEVDAMQGRLDLFAQAMQIDERDYGTAVLSERVEQAVNYAYEKLGIVTFLQHRQELKRSGRV